MWCDERGIHWDSSSMKGDMCFDDWKKEIRKKEKEEWEIIQWYGNDGNLSVEYIDEVVGDNNSCWLGYGGRWMDPQVTEVVLVGVFVVIQNVA